jgi:N utilization substance protein A
MTNEELEEQIDRAVTGFSQIEGMTEELAQKLVEQGYLSYDDLSVIEPDALMEMGSLTEEQVDVITNQAEVLALEAEKAAAVEKVRKKQEDAAEAAQVIKDAKDAATAAAQAAAAPPAAEAAPPAAPAAAPPTGGEGEEPPPQP